MGGNRSIRRTSFVPAMQHRGLRSEKVSNSFLLVMATRSCLILLKDAKLFQMLLSLRSASSRLILKMLLYFASRHCYGRCPSHMDMVADCVFLSAIALT